MYCAHLTSEMILPNKISLSALFTCVMCIVAIIIFLVVGFPRFLYPYEISWGEGSLLIEVQRILSHEAIYSKPTIYYVAWLYEPFYFYLSAFVGEIFGISYVSDRLISLLSTSVLLVLIVKVVFRETKSILLGFAALGLYLAAYGKTGACMLVARVDPLFVLLLVGSAISLLYSRNRFILILSGLLFTLSYFTKQTGLLFLPAMAIYLWRIRGWKEMVTFCISVLISILIVLSVLNYLYGNWFTFYTMAIPSAKTNSVRWGYAIEGTLRYIVMRCWSVATLVAFAILYRNWRRTISGIEDPSLFFSLIFLSALLAGFMGILNQGGEHNVLLPLAACCAILLPIALHDIKQLTIGSLIPSWIIPIQLVLLISLLWNDERNQATTENSRNQERFNKYISSLPGEIWLPFHVIPKTLCQKNTYAELTAIQDALSVGGEISIGLQHCMDTALTNHHWTYIISDLPESFRHYKLRETMDNLNKVHLTDEVI